MKLTSIIYAFVIMLVAPLNNIKACCYVQNDTPDAPIRVETSKETSFTLKAQQKLELKKSDYPIVVSYADSSCSTSLTINYPGCDGISQDSAKGACPDITRWNYCALSGT